MRGTVKVEHIGFADTHFEESGIPRGKLTLPEGATVDGELIAFGEDELYLHCVVSETGNYYGVFKSIDDNHLYQRLVELNRAH